MRGRAGERQDWLKLALGFNTVVSVVSWATEVSTDPNCSGIMAPDITLGCSVGLDITIATVAAQATQTNMTPVAEQGHQHGLR